MTDPAKDKSPQETVTDKQLEEVAGGNTIHTRPIEQLEPNDSSEKEEDDNSINLHELRIEERARRNK